MHDTWDIVKTQPHEKVENPWEHTYVWDGSKYVVNDNRDSLCRNIFPDQVDRITDNEVVLKNGVEIPFSLIPTAAKLKWG